jgi:flagellar L-ring protein precursor FlgH
MGKNSIISTSSSNYWCTSAAFFLLNVWLILPAQVTAQQSLYEDYKARRIGDVITIVLQENISGSSNTDYSNKSSTAGEAQGGVSGNLTPFLPLFGANASVDYQTDDRNKSAQSQLLRGTLSARVEQVTPSGDLLIVGSRSTHINGEFHSIEVKGYVRPGDINADNQVPSFRIANAEIVYEKEGGLKQERKRPGFWKRAAWVVVGLGLTTAIVLKSL